MPSLQQRYFDLLMERVGGDRYPSHEMLDRVEASFWTPEQLAEYVDMLLDHVEQDWYPSHQMLDRIQRIMQMVAVAA